MIARLQTMPFVVIATARPGLESRWTPDPGRHNSLVLRLDPLDELATAELVRELMCGDADDETVAFLLDRSGGNPFFVEELVAFVQDTTAATSLREVPATLHGLVAARLDALDRRERSLLEDCAVVGNSGPIARCCRSRCVPIPGPCSIGSPSATSSTSRTTSSISSPS